MEAGRELDAKVAEALGWDITPTAAKFNPENDIEVDYVIDDAPAECPEGLKSVTGQIIVRRLPDFSTTWEGMGVLVEEARKQGIYIDILPRANGYHIVWGKRWADNLVISDAPYGVCIGLLKAKAVAAV
ncbi:hypothetical protein NDK47_24165 [Brevibacillus ruminantium]|uniref:Phage ABA sandwich domain-containing protein n=1 Tax=Brevibacillus ruminantium TaxID=2950604 RepID=A0ABY4WDP2_9BACL|nr:hypothetical protein [Brevibacillus ruminantium]USG64005.1 hypothetical protein NDK47_17805 [Brevibacillus ruminantium]USG65182.1 hypothetical protein NDK47_24165 [Brevibacillus ruminantium]